MVSAMGDVAVVEQRIVEIREAAEAGDFGRAYGLEVELHADALEYLRDFTGPESGREGWDLAAQVLRTREIDFHRAGS